VIQNVHSSYTAHHVHDAYVPHAMIASSSHTSFLCGRHRHNVHNAKLVNVPKMSNASNGSSILYHTFDASYVLHCKSGKAVATHVSPRHKNGKTCVWVPTSYVTNP
jgi:rhodanese-related sulfurtransferase